MYKLLLSLILASTFSLAGLVNGVAIVVNDDPITLYDIDQAMVENNVNKNQAVSLLVDKILYKQLVKKNNITADVFDVNAYIEKLAASNGMDVYAFKSIIKQRYSDYSVFEEEAKSAVIRQKLLAKIVKGQLKIANEEDMKIYYENNQNKFTTAKTVELVQYAARNKGVLLNTIKNPLLVPADVKRTTLSLKMKDLDPQLQYLLNSTKVGSFTPVFTASRAYNALYIIKKDGTAILDYETVKSKIFTEIMSVREKKYLKDYFEKEKLTADIKIVR